MKTIIIWLLERELERCKKDLQKETHSIIKKAKEHRVETYKTALLFLKE